MRQSWGLLTLLSAVSILSSASCFEWSYCGGKQSGLQTLSDVKLSPADPIPAGSTANFSITGVSEIEVDDSTLKLSVYYLGLPVYHKTTDVHDHIPKGAFSSSVAEQLPSYTPPGSYKVIIESKTTDDRLLSCVEVQFSITWPSFKRAYIKAQ